MQLSLVARFYGCLFYELITHIALWFFVTLLVSLSFHIEIAENPNILRIILWIASGLYFIFSWSKGGPDSCNESLEAKAYSAEELPILFFSVPIFFGYSRHLVNFIVLSEYLVWWKTVCARFDSKV